MAVVRFAGQHGAETARRLRWHGLVYLPLAAIWALAYWRLFVDPTPRLPLVFNWTPSLPYKVAWVTHVEPSTLKRGDYVLYRFAGDAIRDYPGLAGQPFFKIVRGLPGDEITVSERRVFVNGALIGIAKPFTFDGRPLQPIAPGTIPSGFLFMQGTAADSFDSRYAQSGLVRDAQVLGRVEPLF